MKRRSTVPAKPSSPKSSTAFNLANAQVTFARAMSTVTAGLSVERRSYYRTPDHNREVGGQPRSQHLLGLAMDFTGHDAPVVAQRAAALGFVVVKEASHLHVQAFQKGEVPTTWYVSALGPAWRDTETA